MKHQSPGYNSAKPRKNFGSWRVQSSESSQKKDEFDELVVRLGENQGIHLEVMNDECMFIDIAGCVFNLIRHQGIWFLAFWETRDAVLLVDQKATKMTALNTDLIVPTAKDMAYVKRGLAALKKIQIANERRFGKIKKK